MSILLSMEAITNNFSLRCCKLSLRPPVFNKNLITTSQKAQRRMINRTRCEAGDHNHDHDMGKSVDESMIVLRLRIKEMKMLEEANQEAAPSNWMEWEKHYYYCGHYYHDVFEAIRLLQSCLMSLRPSFALGMFALVALSMLMSSGVALFHALEISKSLLIICFGSIRSYLDWLIQIIFGFKNY